jgi:uncharacterized membrane protein
MTTYLITLLTLIILDALWLLVVAKAFYKKYIGYILAEQVVYWPVVLFYTLYAYGIVYFAVAPALETKSFVLAVQRGAFLGLLAYGAYDFTNQATLAKWPWQVTVVDLLWGITITALASGVTYLVVSKI